MSDYKKNIGARVRTARLLRGLTQEQLAEKLDASVSCISRFETGSSVPSIKSLLELSDILDVGIEYFLYDYVTDHTISDPLSSEILAQVEPLPDSYKRHLLNVIGSLYCNVLQGEEQE